jgi:fatty-acyl-CoA synthase
MDIELDWLKRWNMYGPGRVALSDLATGRSITYAELYRMSGLLAEHLVQRGVGAGDRVAVLAKNHWSFVPLFFACHRLGAALVPVNFRFTGREVEHIILDSGPKAIVAHSEYAPLLGKWAERLIPLDKGGGISAEFGGGISDWLECGGWNGEPRPVAGGEDTLAMILYTSGTTGFPKGAMVTRKMMFWNSLNTTIRLNLTEDDAHIAFLPFFHTGGWNVLLTPSVHRGARTILMEKFDPGAVLETVAKEKVTILFGVPTMLDMMARHPSFATADLSSVRYAIVGGEPMPVPLIRTWQERGIAIRQGYGLTEFGPNVFSLNAGDAERKIGSIGFPNFYVDARIVGGDGTELGDDEIGELVLRGPTCMAGYWGNPAATAETIKDGWLHTGDLMRRDRDGYYYVVGRKKDMYISGGENVYPAEIEQVLRQHPAVVEAAVIGVVDAKWGEVGKAFVVTAGPLNAEDVTAYCAERLAKYKVPKHVQIVTSLPKGDSGKVLKRMLVEGEANSTRFKSCF